MKRLGLDNKVKEELLLSINRIEELENKCSVLTEKLNIANEKCAVLTEELNRSTERCAIFEANYQQAGKDLKALYERYEEMYDTPRLGCHTVFSFP